MRTLSLDTIIHYLEPSLKSLSLLSDLAIVTCAQCCRHFYKKMAETIKDSQVNVGNWEWGEGEVNKVKYIKCRL